MSKSIIYKIINHFAYFAIDTITHLVYNTPNNRGNGTDKHQTPPIIATHRGNGAIKTVLQTVFPMSSNRPTIKQGKTWESGNATELGG